MTFYVEPAALRAAAGRFATSAQHLSSVSDYHAGNSDIGSWNQGLIQLDDDHTEFAGALQSRLREAVQFLATSAERLRAAADLYDKTDAVSAAALDATYDGADRPDLYWRGR